MNFSSILRRLRGVEETKGAREATLTFPDGSTRAIRVRNQNQLKLCFDVFAKMRSYPPAPPAEVVLPPPPPEPTTANDRALELLGRAESCEGPRFLQTIHQMAKTVNERRSKQNERETGGQTARTLHDEK
jgi:hypothetical protein